MKIVVLIYQIIQEKFAYGKLFMLVMIGYIFIIKMVKKMQNSGLEMVGGLTPPLTITKKNSSTVRTLVSAKITGADPGYVKRGESRSKGGMGG